MTDDPTHDDVRTLFGDYADGRLDDWRRAVVDQHLYWCLPCRLELRDTLARPRERPPARPRWWRRRRSTRAPGR